jgi:hypothetical protein
LNPRGYGTARLRGFCFPGPWLRGGCGWLGHPHGFLSRVQPVHRCLGPRGPAFRVNRIRRRSALVSRRWKTRRSKSDFAYWPASLLARGLVSTLRARARARKRRRHLRRGRRQAVACDPATGGKVPLTWRSPTLSIAGDVGHSSAASDRLTVSFIATVPGRTRHARWP